MWEEREWIESHLDVNEIRNQVTDVNKLLTGGLNHPCQRLHRAQIICVCADICAFSVLDNETFGRHLRYLPKVSI